MTTSNTILQVEEAPVDTPQIQPVELIKSEPVNIISSTEIKVDWESVELMRVDNLGFKTSEGKTLLTCLIPTCQLCHLDRQAFLEHIFSSHTGFCWEGYCYLCEAQIVATNAFLAKEFEHIERVHLKIHNSLMPSTMDLTVSEDYQPKIKMRKLGDLF